MSTPRTSRKSKSAPSKNQYTAELSSSQLVLGITILMVFGLACFLLGVLIGKFDPSLRPDELVAKSNTQDADQAAPAAKVESATKDKTATPDRNTKIAKSTTPVVEEKQIVVKPRKKATEPATQVPKSISPSIETAKPVTSKKVVIPKNTPQNALIEISTEQSKSSRIDTKLASTPSPTSPTPPAIAKADWGVQVASFKSASSAEAERKRLEAKLPFKIEIMKRKGEVWSRLLIGHYPTKTEADVLRGKLINEHNLNEPWSVNRN